MDTDKPSEQVRNPVGHPKGPVQMPDEYKLFEVGGHGRLLGQTVITVLRDPVTMEVMIRGPRNMLVSLHENEILELDKLPRLHFLLNKAWLENRLNPTEADIRKRELYGVPDLTDQLREKLLLLLEMQTVIEEQEGTESARRQSLPSKPVKKKGEKLNEPSESVQQEPDESANKVQLELLAGKPVLGMTEEEWQAAQEAQLQKAQIGMPPMSPRLQELINHPPKLVNPAKLQPRPHDWQVAIAEADASAGSEPQPQLQHGTPDEVAPQDSLPPADPLGDVAEQSESTDWGRNPTDLSDDGLYLVTTALQYVTIGQHHRALENTAAVVETDIDAAISAVQMTLHMLNSVAVNYQARRLMEMEARKARMLKQIMKPTPSRQ